MSPLLTSLLKDTYTIASLRYKLRILKASLLQNLFGGKEQFDAEDVLWLKSLPAEFYKNFNKDNVYQIFAQTEKEIAGIKILTLYLTFEPDNQTLALIGIKVRKTFTTPLLLDIKYDPKLIAGATLVWNGTSKEYSLRNTISEKKQLILESFKRYLR